MRRNVPVCAAVCGMLNVTPVSGSIIYSAKLHCIMDDDKQTAQQNDTAGADAPAGGASADSSDTAEKGSSIVEEAAQATVDATREAMNKITEVAENALEGTVQATREAINTLTEVASIDVNEVVSGSDKAAASGDAAGAADNTGTGDEEKKEEA